MEKIKLVDKLKNQKEENVLEEALKWCLFDYTKVKILDENSHYIYDKVVYYLMNSTEKVGLWTEDEIKVIITYFAHDLASKFKLEDKIDFQILSKEDSLPDSYGVCYDNADGTYTIEYSYRVIEGFLKGKDVPMRAMQTIFHEVIHVIQNELIKGRLLGDGDEYYSSKMYIMTLEHLTKKVDKQFYDKNYEKLLKENHANKVGLQFAITYLKKYGPKFYSLYNTDAL